MKSKSTDPVEKTSIKKAFREIIWPRRGRLLLGLGLIFISRIASLVLPGANKYFVDDVLVNKNQSELWVLVGLVFGAIIIQASSSFFLTKFLAIEAQRFIAELRLQVTEKVLALPTFFFDQNKSGALVSRIMRDVEGVRNLVGTGVVQMVGGLFSAIVTAIILIQLSPVLTGLVLIPLIIHSYVSLQFFKKLRPLFRKRGGINAEVTGRLTETLNGIRVIKGFHAEKQELKLIDKGYQRIFENVRQSMTITSLVGSASTLFLGSAGVLVMGYSGFQIIQGAMTIGDFVAFSAYIGFLSAPIIEISNIGSQFTDAFAGLDRTEELMTFPSEDENKERTIALSNIEGEVKFDDVTFGYIKDTPVLHNINFESPKGSVTALVGSSGSGKSTIAGLVAGFTNPQKGVISIDGTNLSKVKLNTYRSHIGLVLQDDFLFAGSIRENILFAKGNASEEELEEAVKAAYVNEFTDRFEEGLDTIIGERGVRLSGGQKQRITIARAILADPIILILDEATSALDTESEQYIQQSLDRLLEGRTTFVIAHRLSTIQKADQILVIEEGKIVEKGTHEELLNLGDRYHRLYNLQVRI